jgi:hypothetical protein
MSPLTTLNCLLSYVDKRNKRENAAKQSVKLAMQEFETISTETVSNNTSQQPDKKDKQTDSTKPQTKSSRKRAKKELPKMTFNEGNVNS